MAEKDLNQWAIRYRPQSIEQLIADEGLAYRVWDRIQKRDEHAFCITGPTGCGKTTIAKILAYGYTGIPYGTKSPDIHDINVAEDPSTERIRNLVAQSRPMPRGNFRWFILEEAHILQERAATPLLRGIEDSPGHACWALVTNKPEKMLPTLLNRCYSIEVKLADEMRLAERCYWILGNEGVMQQWSDEDRITLCKNIAMASGQIPRQALQMLKSAVDESPRHRTIDGLLQSSVLKSPSYALDVAANRMLIILLRMGLRAYTQGKQNELYKALMQATLDNEPFALMNRLLWVAHTIFVEFSTGVTQPGSYLFKKQAAEVKQLQNMQLEQAVQVCATVVRTLSAAEGRMTDFAVKPQYLLAVAMWDLYTILVPS